MTKLTIAAAHRTGAGTRRQQQTGLCAGRGGWHTVGMAHVDIGIVCHAVFRGAESVYGPAHSLFEGVRALGRTAFLLEHSLETAEPSRLSLDGAAPSAAPGSRAWPGILRHAADSRCTRQVVRRHSAGFLVAVDPLCFLHVRLAVGKRVPVVFYGADYAERRFRNPILNGVYQALDRHAARRAAAVWSVSEAIRDLRRRQGVPDSHNVVLPNAPEFDPALPARPEEIRGDLALLANLDAGLDTELVAAAFAAVAAARPDAVLHVVGDGRLRPALAARLAAAGLSGRVRFHGHLPRPEALAVVARCRVALAVYAADCAWHAYRDSVKVRDYAAAGVPVVSTPGHGLCAAIEQAGFGRVAADAPSVAAAALAWLSDPAAAAAARRRALEFAQAHSRGRLLRRALATVDAGGGGAR
jgi:glycosyltransferase involved in cell wall biosynthesis